MTMMTALDTGAAHEFANLLGALQFMWVITQWDSRRRIVIDADIGDVTVVMLT